MAAPTEAMVALSLALLSFVKACVRVRIAFRFVAAGSEDKGIDQIVKL
jgi:hypothetical protein